MNKVICDVCGTMYPDTAKQCPICGCAAAEPVEAAPEEPAPAANKPDLTFGEENPQ